MKKPAFAVTYSNTVMAMFFVWAIQPDRRRTNDERSKHQGDDAASGDLVAVTTIGGTRVQSRNPLLNPSNKARGSSMYIDGSGT